MTIAVKVLPLALLLAACAAPPATRRTQPAPPVAPVAPAPTPPFPYTEVWTRNPNTSVRVDSARREVVPHLFTRLEVLGADSALLHVRCTVCARPLEGWVERRAVVYEPSSPAAAAGGELAEFVLAVRAAAARRDTAALRPVMPRHFTHSFSGGEGIIEALAHWRAEGFRSLDRLPALLDRGVGTRDGRVWAAPPEYLVHPAYRDLRTGFRSTAGRWEWIFLVRGDP